MSSFSRSHPLILFSLGSLKQTTYSFPPWPGWLVAWVSMPPNKQHIFGKYWPDSHDGTELGAVLTPGGRSAGTQTLAPPPAVNTRHGCSSFRVRKRRTERQHPVHRKKTKHEEITGEPARASLALRAESMGMEMPLDSGPDLDKARNSF